MKAIRTDIAINDKNNFISIIRETEKAILLCYNKVYFGVQRDEVTIWCPKSVWNNDRNFSTDVNGQVWFKIPYFLIKE